MTDEKVGARYAALGERRGRDRDPAGRARTRRSRAPSGVLRALAARADHDDHVVALGGGVVGDLAGFCAATYQRGVPVVQVPTTLVAQVDSAYGGKTGVDLPEGKNYVGAYHQPAAVLADPATLATLPPEELAAGWAEVIKTGADRRRRRCGSACARARRRDADRDLVLACARVKLAVVARDERDAGRRQVLNLGHTVGHAIETATGYARYRHGEAVGLGLLAALALSGRPELRDEVARAARRARAADDARRGDRPRAVVARRAARQEAPRRARSASCCVDAPGDVAHRARGARGRAGAARGRAGRAMKQPRGRPARGQPRRARAARPPSSTAA